MSPPPYRIFLGLTEIAGYYGNLKRGFEELGARATFVNLSDHPFRYDPDTSNTLASALKRARRERLATPPARRFRRLALTALEGLLRCALFAWALVAFNVFIFGYGVTFLSRPGLELRLLRLFRKRIICVHHGSDSRPPFLDGSLMASDRARSGADCVRLTRETKRRVSQLDRHVNWVIESPMCGHFHERECVRWFSIGRHCLVGANSVVNKDLPDYSIAFGSTCRIVGRVEVSAEGGVELRYLDSGEGRSP